VPPQTTRITADSSTTSSQGLQVAINYNVAEEGNAATDASDSGNFMAMMVGAGCGVLVIASITVLVVFLKRGKTEKEQMASTQRSVRVVEAPVVSTSDLQIVEESVVTNV